LHYETEIAKETLIELDALQLCFRKKFGTTYRYVIKEEWRELVMRIEHLKPMYGSLESEEPQQEDSSEYHTALDEAFEDGTIFEIPPEQQTL